MSFDKILTTTDDPLLIFYLVLAEEVDGWILRVGVSPGRVVVEKEERGEEKDCQYGECVSRVTLEEGHGAGWALWEGLRG